MSPTPCALTPPGPLSVTVAHSDPATPSRARALDDAGIGGGAYGARSVAGIGNALASAACSRASVRAPARCPTSPGTTQST
eukprot:31422-Pelagococcus_subviridis.AAC.20